MPPARAARATAGAAPGSIIAAIIASHKTVNDPNEPSRVETPKSIPLIRWIAMTQQAAAPSVTARAPVRRAVLPAAIEGRAAAAMPATACPLVLRTSRASLSWDGPGRDGLGLQERSVLALKRLGRPRVPAVGEGQGQGIGEDVLLALADPVEDALRDGLGRSLRDVEGADHVGVHRPGQHGVDPHPLSG